ncbi:recombinase family protein [Streptomyces sp. 5.8]|uniref:recombinase family protein n=1 Tax=Streptomyces sp. 5.8 TaxID=3406571 RepID=UPI003BB757E6
MAPSSTWGPHPSLTAALEAGLTYTEWLRDRKPVVSMARISGDTKKQSLGVARQHRHCDEAAERLGWAVVYQYTDNDITAAKPDVPRPGFLQMVRDLRARCTEEGFRVCGLVVVEEERAVRLPEDLLRLHRALTVEDDGLLYYTDSKQLIDVYSETEQTRGLKSASAGEAEVEKLRRRTKRSIKDRAREGRRTGGQRRFGWLGVERGEDGTVTRPSNKYVDPVEGRHLRRAIEMRLARSSYTTITRYLIGHNVPSVRGGSWIESTVKNMLTNPAICGYRMINGELVIDPDTGIPVVGDWEVIATPEEWLQLVRRSDRKDDSAGEGMLVRYNQKNRGPSGGRKHLLSEFVRCGKLDADGRMCMSVMVGTKPRPKRPNGSYSCGNPRCRGVSRRMDRLDKEMVEMVLKVLEERFSAVAPRDKSWHGEATLESLRVRKFDLKQGFEVGKVSAADFFELLSSLDGQISESEKDRESHATGQAAENFLAGFHRAKWEGFDLHQKRSAIGAVLSHVVVFPMPQRDPHKGSFDASLIEPHFKPTDS